MTPGSYLRRFRAILTVPATPGHKLQSKRKRWTQQGKLLKRKRLGGRLRSEPSGWCGRIRQLRSGPLQQKEV